MAVTFIGDVHGWADRLERVLAQAEGDLVFLGDLIDRGPQAPAVLDRVHALCDAGRARCLLGNHEWMLARVLPPDGGVDPERWGAWVASWGGHAVVKAYGVDDPSGLRAALGDHLPWLAGLPPVLTGGEGDRRWIAVHAGLDPQRPLADQLGELTTPATGPEADLPPAPLFSKQWLTVWPADLPPDTCLVSGHTPRPECLVTPQRILCDTSGGQHGKVLSAVIWPAGRVITG